MAASGLFLERLYGENLKLLEEARAYMGFRRAADATEFPGIRGLHLNLEYLRVSNRLMQSMAWVMAQRAAAAGELTAAEAASDQYMPAADMAIDAAILVPRAEFPRGLASLVDRSVSLHGRVMRLAEQAREAAGAAA